MAEMGDLAEMEAELIKRNREIAKVRDDVLKTEKRLDEAKMRNDDLLEKVSELDAEINKKNTKLTDLEAQVEELTKQVEEKDGKLGDIRKEHCENIDNLRKEMEEKAEASSKDTAAQDALNRKIAEMEAEKDQLMKDLETEKANHKLVKANLETSESSNRDTSGRLVEKNRQHKELEDKLAEMEAENHKTLTAHVESGQEERAKAHSELQTITMQLEEKKFMLDDLEQQLRENANELDTKRVALEDAQREIADHAGIRSDLEAARDEFERKYNELQIGNSEQDKAEKSRMQEQLRKATQKASDLEGRMDMQREMMSDTQDALNKSEQEEEKLRNELEDKAREFEKEREALKAAIEEEKDKGAQEVKAVTARHLSEQQTEEVAYRHQCRAEIDAAERAKLEADDKNTQLTSELTQLRVDYEEAQAQHSRLNESLKGQSGDLKQKLHDAEEKIISVEHDVEKLQKEVQEKDLEAERLTMSHKLEVERLQQTLEAENQARAAAEKISQSKLEEKDTVIEHRAADNERLQHDLEDAKKKIGALEEEAEKARTEAEARAHKLGMNNAQVEGELRARQDRVTEVEGRLEAQRLYLEQVNETLHQVKSDKDTLIGEKGSLEAQLRLEVSHKDAVNHSLQQQQDESEKRCRELEERILRDRDAHKEQIEDVRRSIGDELKQGAERLAAVEAELLTARQRCELLARNKADLLQEVAEHNSKAAGFDATLKEQKNKQETISLELDQVKSLKDTLEDELAKLREEKRMADHRIDELNSAVKGAEDGKLAQEEEFKLKMQRMDDLLTNERKQREETQSSLSNARQDGESKSQESMSMRRKLEQDFLDAKTDGDSWREKAEDTSVKLQSAKEQLEAQKTRAEEVDSQRREVESKLRGDLATAEARLRRLESEVSRANTAVEDGKAAMAEKQSEMTSKISALERQVSEYTKISKNADLAREAAERKMGDQSSSHTSLGERLGMAAEELFTRQVEFALEKQRLSGALEESRRTLRNSLAVPTSTTAIDTVRITGLEQQLAEERRKSIEQAVALQRAERKVTQLDDANKRSEDARQQAVANGRDAERRCVTLSEDLRKAQVKQATADVRLDEVRERAHMASAEIQTVQYVAKYNEARLRGHLDELRYMIKKSESTRR